LQFCNSLITQKTEASIKTLPNAVRALGCLGKGNEKRLFHVDASRRKSAHERNELRALEANAAAAYFRTWRGIPIEWRGTSRRPLPESWKIIEHRTSQFQIAGNRNAAHPVNAILNYAYAVLQTRIQIDAVAEGYDPTIGIMHEKRAGSSAFIFDLMEAERPMIDQKVLEFVKSHVFDPTDFVIRSDGVCRLIRRWRDV
jgi:CRISP-associated protein Cas1